MKFKVLNIAQPNAHNIAHNGKVIENRSKPCHFRGTIAIYASKTIDHARFESQQHTQVSTDECAFGCIVAFADLVDCVIEAPVGPAAKWFHGPYGYVLENVVPLKIPIEVSPPKGAIIWWPLEGDLVAKCLAQAPEVNVVPLTEVDRKTAPKAPLKKSSKRAKLVPSELLGRYIGNDVMNVDEAFDRLAEYIDSKGLYDGETNTITTDDYLKALLPLNTYTGPELFSVLLDNLEFSENQKSG